MNLIKKIKKMPNLYSYFYQPHIENSYYLLSKKKNDFNIDNLLNKSNINFVKIIDNLAEDIYFFNENKIYKKFFQSIRLRTYIEGNYKYSANIIFTLKNNALNEDIYVTVHKNIENLEFFSLEVEKTLLNYFNVKKSFYIKKEKKVFFIKDFELKDNKIKEDYISIAFEKIIGIYDKNHQKINKQFFPSNYILEIEFAGNHNILQVNKLKKNLFNLLKNEFNFYVKKNRKSFDIIKQLIN